MKTMHQAEIERYYSSVLEVLCTELPVVEGLTFLEYLSASVLLLRDPTIVPSSKHGKR